MNPMLRDSIGSIIRHFITIGSGMLVTRGLLTQEAAASLISGLSLALVTIGWAIYQKYTARVKLVTALAIPKVVSEAEVEKVISSADAHPSVTQPKELRPLTIRPPA